MFMEKDDTPTFLQRRWQLMMMMFIFFYKYLRPSVVLRLCAHASQCNPVVTLIRPNQPNLAYFSFFHQD